jgi:molybdate transport system substrate-binding protein
MRKTKVIASWGSLLAAVVVFGVAAGAQNQPTLADAKPGDVRLIATAAIRFPPELIAQAEKAIGKKVVVQYGSARGNLKDMILKGQDFEAAILLPDVNEELFKSGKVLAETHEIAGVPIGFALRGDVPVMDVGTPAAVKTAFLNARSVKYSPTGAAILTVRKVLSTLEIADKIIDSSAIRTEVPLGPGEYEINIYPISEIIPNSKLKNLGTVIPPLQVPAILQVVIGRNANDPNAAKALIAFLQGPAIDGMLKQNGIVKSVVNGRLQ